MFNFVVWSFVVALTPVALGWAWKLAAGISHRIALGYARAFEDVESWGPHRPLNFDPPSGYIAMTGRISGTRTGRP